MEKSVLIIGPSTDGNGGISSVIKTYTQTEKLCRKIELIASYKDGNKIEKTIAFIKGYYKCFWKLALDNKIKIVHIHSASRASFKRKRYFVILSKLFKKKVIFHIHGAEFIEFYKECNTKNKRKIEDTLSSVDKVIALSNMWKEELLNISENSNVSIIYNPVIVDKFNRSALDDLNILFMGRVGERKGIYDILEVMPEIIKKYPSSKLYIGGDGDLERIRTIVDNNKLSDNIEILGWISGDKKIELYEKSSIYVLPSYNEGMPISILEAMSCGIPTIATNIAGIPEQISQGKHGYLISPGDKQMLYARIVNLLEDEQMRKHMGDASYKKAKNTFDISVIEDIIMREYSELM